MGHVGGAGIIQCCYLMNERFWGEVGKGTNGEVKGKKDKENILQERDRNQTCADETCCLLPNKVTLMRKGRRTKPNKKGRTYTGMRAYSYMRSLTSHKPILPDS